MSILREQFCEFLDTNPAARPADSYTSTSRSLRSSLSATRRIPLHTEDSSRALVASSSRRNSTATSRKPRSESRPCRPPFSQPPYDCIPGTLYATVRVGAVPVGACTEACLSGVQRVSARLGERGTGFASGRAWLGVHLSLWQLRRGCG